MYNCFYFICCWSVVNHHDNRQCIYWQSFRTTFGHTLTVLLLDIKVDVNAHKEAMSLSSLKCYVESFNQVQPTNNAPLKGSLLWLDILCRTSNVNWLILSPVGNQIAVNNVPSHWKFFDLPSPTQTAFYPLPSYICPFPLPHRDFFMFPYPVVKKSLTSPALEKISP